MTKEFNTFTAEIIGPIPERLTVETVRSATEYLVMVHLVRPLVRLSKTGQIEGDLSDYWKISEDFRTYSFHISPSAKWSDGSAIDASDVERSFNQQIKTGSTTHFDFRIIDSVSSEGEFFYLRLKERNPNLLRQLIHPELGTVFFDKKDSSSFSKTSGPYSVVSMDNQMIELTKNQHFPWADPRSPAKLIFKISNSVEQQVDSLKKHIADFIIPMSGISHELFSSIQSDNNIQKVDPRIGYTFWIAPKTQSSLFQDTKNRLLFAKLIKLVHLDFPSNAPYWQKADQLYLNDGFGRPKPDELERIWSTIRSVQSTNLKKIRILGSASFPFWQEIKSGLSKLGIEIEIQLYENLRDFENKYRDPSFDAFQINNDFSSADVLENLKVTFSDSRPLVSAESNNLHYKVLLDKATLAQDNNTKHEILKQIGIDLLSHGHVIPVAYRSNILFANSKWDFNSWSLLFPDVRFWKIKPRD